MSDRLFSDGDLHATLAAHGQKYLSRVATLPAALVRDEPEKAVQALIEDASVEPLVFVWEAISRTPLGETRVEMMQFGEQISVPGQAVTIHVPFTGDPILLQTQASTFSLSGFPYDVRVLRDHLDVTFSDTQLSPEKIASEFTRFKERLSERAGWANDDVAQWTAGFRADATNVVTRRKAQLDEIAAVDASIDIPLG